MCAFVIAGGFPSVAAEAAEVEPDVFARWMESASRKPGKWNARHRALKRRLVAAQAQARLAAEMKVYTDDPIRWLQSGPGRETIDKAGWTVPVKPLAKRPEQDAGHLSLDSEILRKLHEVLAPYPDARRALATALGEEAG